MARAEGQSSAAPAISHTVIECSKRLPAFMTSESVANENGQWPAKLPAALRDGHCRLQSRSIDPLGSGDIRTEVDRRLRRRKPPTIGARRMLRIVHAARTLTKIMGTPLSWAHCCAFHVHC